VVRVRLELEGGERRTLVPRDAIASEFGLHYGYVIEPAPDASLVARRRRVEVRQVPFLPTELDVVAGLESGEEIAVSALQLLRDGAPVERSSASVARSGGAP